MTWPVERFLVVSPFVSYGIYGTLLLWTLWYRKSLRQRASETGDATGGFAE